MPFPPAGEDTQCPLIACRPWERRRKRGAPFRARRTFCNAVQPASRFTGIAAYRLEKHMENVSNILTIKEVAEILRCSKAHVQNVLIGKVRGVPRLAHLRVGRRKLIRKEWLDQWMETHKTG